MIKYRLTCKNCNISFDSWFASSREYEKLKKFNPSYTDKFDLISLENKFDEWKGIVANVIRKTDQRKFKIPLAELVPTDKKPKNYMLLDDYSVWFVNY